MERNFQVELKNAQTKVKELGQVRDKLVGDSRVEQSKVKQALEALKTLGIENADKLTVEQLSALRDSTQKDLETNLDSLATQIAQGEALTREYETAPAA
jgi:hypothetical protein